MKILYMIPITLLLFGLTGCGDEGSSSSGSGNIINGNDNIISVCANDVDSGNNTSGASSNSCPIELPPSSGTDSCAGVPNSPNGCSCQSAIEGSCVRDDDL